MAGKNPLQAIERQVIRVLARQHVRQQTRAWQALLDRLRRHRRGHHMTFAMRAGILQPHVLADKKRRRHVLQLLRDLFADALQRLLALLAGALRLRHVVFDSLARQIRRQSTTPMAPAHNPHGLLSRRRLHLFDLGHRQLP